MRRTLFVLVLALLAAACAEPMGPTIAIQYEECIVQRPDGSVVFTACP